MLASSLPQRGFYRALHSLAHPISLASILILLINDHYLRLVYPSWLTGKISDIAWLIFAPLICAAVLCIFIKSERAAGIFSFGFIGLWFVGGKTIPFVHALTLDLLHALFGIRGLLRLDSSDLIALPALLVGWHLWQHASTRPLKLNGKGGYLLALGMVGTVGNSLPMDYGVMCVDYQDEHLYASANTRYESKDGGLHWSPAASDTAQEICTYTGNKIQVLTHPENPRLQYRFMYDATIEQSTDGGQHWQIIYDLNFLEDNNRTYFQKNNNPACKESICEFSAVPYNIIYHPPTGNIIFSMGINGVLVYQPDGEWRWASVGAYQYFDQDLPPRVVGLTRYLALALALIVTVGITAYRHQRPPNRIWLYFWSAFYGGIWVVLVMIHWLPVLPSETYWDPVWETAIPVVFMVLIVQPVVPFALSLLHDVAEQDRKSLLISLSVAGLCVIAFLLPYLLWSMGEVEIYKLAKGASLLMVGAALLLSYPFWTRNHS